jgi:polyribonucleotide nucleotidyltransferase
VNFFGAKDGLVHVSQISQERVAKVSDVLKEGDKVKVKLMGFDDRGKTRLSMKVVDQTTGEDLEAKGGSAVPAGGEAPAADAPSEGGDEQRSGGRRRRGPRREEAAE